MNLSYLLEGIGVIGVGTIIAAYFLLLRGRLKADSVRYYVLNCLGSIGIIISLTQNWNLSAFLIEFFWCAISIMGIIKFLRRKA
jgi:hypothetical protein